MGRGPGNARTEELVIEAEAIRKRRANLVPLMNLIRQTFEPMKAYYNWGTNSYYYLAGKYGIHTTYIQEMIGDARYDDEDILAVIDRLRAEGGKKFSINSLHGAKQFYCGDPRGYWKPAELLAGREVLILGSGAGVEAHAPALEAYVKRVQPLVLALNTQASIDLSLINLRIACHPVRLLADAQEYANLPQPLIAPLSMLPEDIRNELRGNEVLDFGLAIESGRFEFHDTYCIVPTSFVFNYALGVVTSGSAKRILMAGFDGYPRGDKRNDEMNELLRYYQQSCPTMSLHSVTSSAYDIPKVSIYGL